MLQSTRSLPRAPLSEWPTDPILVLICWVVGSQCKLYIVKSCFCTFTFTRHSLSDIRLCVSLSPFCFKSMDSTTFWSQFLLHSSKQIQTLDKTHHLTQTNKPLLLRPPFGQAINLNRTTFLDFNFHAVKESVFVLTIVFAVQKNKYKSTTL